MGARRVDGREDKAESRAGGGGAWFKASHSFLHPNISRRCGLQTMKGEDVKGEVRISEDHYTELGTMGLNDNKEGGEESAEGRASAAVHLRHVKASRESHARSMVPQRSAAP